jgi:hypothetical protein
MKVLLSMPPVQNSCKLSTEGSTNWVPSWWPFHTNLLVFSLQADFQLTADNSNNCFVANSKLKSKSKSKLLYDWRFTASQFVLVSSPLRLTMREFFFQLNLCSHSTCVTLSDEKMGLSLMNMLGLSSSVRIAHTRIPYYWKFFHLHYIQVLCQYRLYKADHAYLTYLILQRQLSRLNRHELDTAMFKALIFSTPGYDLSYTRNMSILMILNDFCLLPAQFCYIIVHIRKIESRVQIANRCVLWKISNGAKNLFL